MVSFKVHPGIRFWELRKTMKKNFRDSLRHSRDQNKIQNSHCFRHLSWCFSLKVGTLSEWKDTRAKYRTVINSIPSLMPTLPITVGARSKASVCGRSFDGIVGSNPAGGTHVCC